MGWWYAFSINLLVRLNPFFPPSSSFQIQEYMYKEKLYRKVIFASDKSELIAMYNPQLHAYQAWLYPGKDTAAAGKVLYTSHQERAHDIFEAIGASK